MTLTSGVVGVPGSEPTMLFAGFNVSQGTCTLFGIIVFGVLGDMIGASIAYAIGYWGREELVERHGNKLHISKQRLDRAHRWFDRYGAPVIVVSRCIPFARAAFPYAAGVAQDGVRAVCGLRHHRLDHLDQRPGRARQRGREQLAELAAQPRVRRLRRRRPAAWRRSPT